MTGGKVGSAIQENLAKLGTVWNHRLRPFSPLGLTWLDDWSMIHVVLVRVKPARFPVRSIRYGMLQFAQPSILGGLARTLDIGGTFASYNVSSSPFETDQDAIASDWYAVGLDLLGAMNRYASRVQGESTGLGKARSVSDQKANDGRSGR